MRAQLQHHFWHYNPLWALQSVKGFPVSCAERSQGKRHPEYGTGIRQRVFSFKTLAKAIPTRLLQLRGNFRADFKKIKQAFPDEAADALAASVASSTFSKVISRPVSQLVESQLARPKYGGTSLIRNSALLGPYSRTVPRDLLWS